MKTKRKGVIYTVKCIDYYGEYENLVSADGKELAAGGVRRVTVFWPDKSITMERLFVERGTGEAQVDMNRHPDHFQTQRLFVQTKYHGRKCKVSLTGLKVEVA
jgi:hypothetical protein